MKILVIATHILSNDIGSGGDVLFINIARRWQQQGNDVQVLLATAGSEAYTQACAPARSLMLSRTWLDNSRRYFGHPLLIALVYIGRAVRAIPLVQRLPAEVLYTPGDFWCDVLPTVVKKIRQPRVTWAAAIFHINDPPWRRRGNSLIASVLSWMAQRLSFFLIKWQANVIFALNHAVKKSLVENGFTPERIYVMGAGIDRAALEKIPEYTPRYAACSVGRINPTKGVIALPAIWKRVVEAVPGSQLVIVGKASTAWEKQLRVAIATAGMQEHVMYKGYLPSAADVVRCLKESRLFISASTEEGFGISIAEAMMCGRPVVAYDLPVYREFFTDGITSAPVGDTAAFARAIIRLLTDANHYATQRRAAKHAVAGYDWDTVARAELRCIREAHDRVTLPNI